MFNRLLTGRSTSAAVPISTGRRLTLCVHLHCPPACPTILLYLCSSVRSVYRFIGCNCVQCVCFCFFLCALVPSTRNLFVSYTTSLSPSELLVASLTECTTVSYNLRCFIEMAARSQRRLQFLILRRCSDYCSPSRTPRLCYYNILYFDGCHSIATEIICASSMIEW